MRSTGTCPSCGGQEILLVAHLPDTGDVAPPTSSFQPPPPRISEKDEGKDRNEHRPLYVAAVPQKRYSWEAPSYILAGKLEAAVCRSCGLTQLYAAKPGEIPIDGTMVRLMTPPPAAAPFR